jgi:hypothetical protein
MWELSLDRGGNDPFPALAGRLSPGRWTWNTGTLCNWLTGGESSHVESAAGNRWALCLRATGAAMKEKPPQPNIIVLDANLFIADYWLRSPSFVLLRHFLSKTKATLAVPKIVVEEVVNHHKEDIATVRANILTAFRDATRLMRKFKRGEGLIAAIAKAQIQDPYDKFLSSELTGLNAQISDYSEISHTDIVKRDLRRKRPFQQSGKGYRDTLLWETIVRNHVEQDRFTVFITQNVRDFCNSDGSLHDDLEADVKAQTKSKGSLVVSRDLPSFTDTYIVPYLTSRKDFAVLVQNGKVAGLNLYEVSDRNIDALVKAVEESPSVMIDDPGTYEPDVDVIEIPKEFDVEQASEVSEKLLLVIYKFLAFVFITFFLSQGEYAMMSDEETSRIDVLEHFWNEHVMRVQTYREVQFRCRLTFNSDTKKVESFEVEDVAEVQEV